MSSLPPHLQAFVDQTEAALARQKGEDFERLNEGLFQVQVCTSLSNEDATARMNLTASGTSGGWQLDTSPENAPVPVCRQPRVPPTPAVRVLIATVTDPAARLCVCGVRGCDLAELHCAAFVTPARSRKGQTVKHRRGRRT